jgi:hypothetical protein
MYLYENQQTHIYEYVHWHIIIQQHVLVTTVAIIRVSYNKNTVNVQIIVQKSMIKPLNITFDIFSSKSYGV